MKKTVDHWIRIYINKIENRILFKIKRGYYIEFVTPPAMKLLESFKSHITKDENGENISYFEITEVILMIIINKIQESCIHLLLKNRLANY